MTATINRQRKNQKCKVGVAEKETETKEEKRKVYNYQNDEMLHQILRNIIKNDSKIIKYNQIRSIITNINN